jgi:hypothetical protein
MKKREISVRKHIRRSSKGFSIVKKHKRRLKGQLDIYGQASKKEKKKIKIVEKRRICNYCRKIREHEDWNIMNRFSSNLFDYSQAINNKIFHYEDGYWNITQLISQIKEIIRKDIQEGIAQELISYFQKIQIIGQEMCSHCTAIRLYKNREGIQDIAKAIMVYGDKILTIIENYEKQQYTIKEMIKKIQNHIAINIKEGVYQNLLELSKDIEKQTGGLE